MTAGGLSHSLKLMTALKTSLHKKLPLLMLLLALGACESDSSEMTQKAADRPVLLVAESQPTMKQARGLNTHRLFEEPVRNSKERFERLENSVQNLSDEMEVLSPAVIKLMAFESEMQELLNQIRTAREAETEEVKEAQGMPLPLEKMPFQKFEDKKQEAQKPPAPAKVAAKTTSSVREGLNNIRLADHASKTRIVFETKEKMSYTVDLDNKENIMIIDFAEGVNNVETSALKLRSKLIKGVTTTPKGDKGFVLAFPLSKSTRVTDQGAIPPGKENNNFRYYIDLAL